MPKKLPRPSYNELSQIVNLPNRDCINRLEADIRKFYDEKKMSEQLHKRRTDLITMIRNYLNSNGITRQLEPDGIEIHALTVFGSFATRCATIESDLDLCVCARSPGRKSLAVTVLQAIHRDLTNNREALVFFADHPITELTFVHSAKVPIIRFKIDGVAVDLSASFEANPPRTSLAAKYINAYCQLDERFTILVTFLKTWLKSEGSADDHLRDFPNSYSINLMLIHVLQWYNIFPNLHATDNQLFHRKFWTDWQMTDLTHDFKFPLNTNSRTVSHHMRQMWPRSLSIVQLLYLFAFHYSKSEIVDQYRYNMRTGDIEIRPSDTRVSTAVSILDPYDKRNPARSARSSYDLIGSLNTLMHLILNSEENMYTAIMNIPKTKNYVNRNGVFLQPQRPLPLMQNVQHVPPTQLMHYQHQPQAQPRFNNYHPYQNFGSHYAQHQYMPPQQYTPAPPQSYQPQMQHYQQQAFNPWQHRNGFPNGQTWYSQQ